MKGLLIKDIINLKNQAKIILIFILFYGILSFTTKNESMFSGVIAIFCAILPITAMAYDEKSNWNQYALTMPISRKDLVLSKYLLGFILSIVGFVINFVFLLALNAQGPFEQCLGLMAAGIFMMSIVFPLLFQFGVEKGRIILLLVFFTPTALILLISKLGIKPPDASTIKTLLILSPIIVLGIFIVSIYISIQIMNRKEL